MTRVAWREDDFEERRLDPMMVMSGGTNTLILESNVGFWDAEIPDIVYSGRGGQVIIECKMSPKRNEENFLIRLPSGSLKWADRAISLSSALIVEHTQAEPSANASVSEDVAQHSPAAFNPVTRSAYRQLHGLPANIQEAMRRLLADFASYIPVTEWPKVPSLRFAALDDGSYLLEWMFKDRRLGFTFEPDPKDSGWYYVYFGGTSSRYEAGTMDQLEMGRLINMTLKS